MPNRILYIFSILIFAFLIGCKSKYAKVRKNGSFEEKYAMGTKLYEKKDYYKSGVLFESLLPLSAGRKEAESTLIMYAYSQYYQKQYVLSSYHFKKFFETYPRHEKVQEAIYMRAMSLFMLSPVPSLDQENTRMAITAFQNFINRYPESEYAASVNVKIDELQRKLELKSYENTKLYVKIRNYKSAIIAIESFRLDYPSSEFNEELQFLKIGTQFDLAKKSLPMVTDEDGNIVHLKKNRLEKAASFYYNFIDSYPESEYLKDAESIYRNIEIKLSEFD